MNSIYEIVRRYDFDRTEPETLLGLVEEAIDKGDAAKQEHERLRNAASDLLALLRDAGLILDTELRGLEDILAGCAAGEDGSYQPVGGAGGKWYVPLSCALVVFEDGIRGQPRVEVDTHIEVIQEQEYARVGVLSSERMLLVETKAIMKWAMDGRPSVLFIDGPIVDPPLCRWQDYIRYRCSAIKECLGRNIKVIGCAKRFKESFFKKHLVSQAIKGKRERAKLDMFPSDLQVIVFVFAHHWRQDGASGKGLYTHAIDASEVDEMHRLYLENGLRIFSTFVQKSLGQYILRLDLPFLETDLPNDREILAQVGQAVRATFAWTYPDQNIPLPIFIADAKCEIRRGCAEILYEEIMTRIRTTEPIDQIALLQLEARQ